VKKRSISGILTEAKERLRHQSDHCQQAIDSLRIRSQINITYHESTTGAPACDY
jgi:hypothetical protein